MRLPLRVTLPVAGPVLVVVFKVRVLTPREALPPLEPVVFASQNFQQPRFVANDRICAPEAPELVMVMFIPAVMVFNINAVADEEESLSDAEPPVESARVGPASVIVSAPGMPVVAIVIPVLAVSVFITVTKADELESRRTIPPPVESATVPPPVTLLVIVII